MICSLCGNLIENKTTCPFCGQKNKTQKKRNTRRKKFRTVNIKEDMPRANTANKRIENVIRKHYNSDTKVLKIIHGYGSTGKGGTIKDIAHQNLKSFKARGLIKLFVPGEQFSNINNKGRKLIKYVPEKKNDKDWQKNNRGVTLILF